jgi:hypothetical protein
MHDVAMRADTHGSGEDAREMVLAASAIFASVETSIGSSM